MTHFNWLRRIRVTFTGLGHSGKTVMEADGTPMNYHITAGIEKNIQTARSVSTVTIHNLSPETRSKLAKPGIKLQIEAGWDEGPRRRLSIVFVGQLLAAHSLRRETDIITTLHVQSGQESVVTTHIRRLWGAGTPLTRVLMEVVGELPDIRNNEARLVGLDRMKVGSGGYSVSSDAETVLYQLGDEIGFSWSIIDGKFQAIADKEGTKETGTLQAPELIEVAPILSGVRRFQRGVFGRCMFRPTMNPGNFQKIIAAVEESCTGEFRLNRVTHQLDTYGTAFFTGFTAFSRQKGNK